MFTWESSKKGRIFWFSERHYKMNLKNIDKKEMPKEECFMSYTLPVGLTFSQGIIVKAEYSTDEYVKNFVTNLPENPIIYFSNFSKFARSKLDLINAKRTTKPEKANIIVLDNYSYIQHLPAKYYVFYDFGLFYIIDDISYYTYFKCDVTAFKTAPIGTNLEDPKLVYCGPLKAIDDYNLSISNFYNGIYKAPFILDTTLDKIIYNTLTIPNVNELHSIVNMLHSNDKSTIRFGLQVLSSFNVCSIPLTTRLIIMTRPNWPDYSGAFTNNLVQMCKTLGINKLLYKEVWKALGDIEDCNIEYSEEDINLSKEVAKYIPGLKDALNMYQPFYVDTLKFIPDEYKV